jgi:rubrerythrin
MSEWECGVCGYLHKEGQAPEKCPICEAPEKMFSVNNNESEGADVDKVAEEQAQAPLPEKDSVKVVKEKESLPDKQWRCSVSGYLHTGPEPPEKCPVCEAGAEQFEEVVEPLTEEINQQPEAVETDRRWRCTVCGYIHEGEGPPEKCPLCGADASFFEEVDAEGNAIGGESEATKEIDTSSPPVAENKEVQEGTTLYGAITKLILKLHLHPIHTHFPNGILPVVVVFLGLAIYFDIAALETAAFFNSIVVLIMLPMVMFTGYVEWQKRYKGLKSALFITKIISSLIVLATVNVLVFWRVIDPSVAAEGSPTQLIYFGVAALALAAAGVAGHIGGKLVFAGRN